MSYEIAQALQHLLSSDTWRTGELSLEEIAITSEYGAAVGLAALRQFCGVGKASSGLRLSSLGKPAVLQAMELPHIKTQLVDADPYAAEEISVKMREIFHRGDQYEAFVLMMLKLGGYEVVSTQSTVNYLGVVGHTDAIIRIGGSEVLLEVKTMSDVYFNQFTKRQNDDRGYITQLATYASCTGIQPLWICINKGNHEVRVIEPDMQQMMDALSRAQNIIPKFALVHQLSDVLKVFSPPPGVEEVYKRQGTGKYLLHPSIKYSPYRHLFYHIYEEENGYGKQTEYIAAVREAIELNEFADF